MGILQRLLEHPLTKGLSVDDPNTTSLRRQIIEQKPYLHSIYSEWYALILQALPATTDVLELGSGAGFLKSIIPDVITSEILFIEGIDVVADGCMMPFGDNSLNGIVMTDVFHHIPNVEKFLREASRCIRPGGKIVMVEPWRTSWSEWVYTHLHSEPFSPDSGWEIPSTGPLSGANGALPWIVFERDRDRFENEFPNWRINSIQPLMPLAYLLSGGVSMRSLIPNFLYGPTRHVEKWLEKSCGSMFALIDLEKTS